MSESRNTIPTPAQFVGFEGAFATSKSSMWLESEIGALLPQLDPRHNGAPIDHEQANAAAWSNRHAQVVSVRQTDEGPKLAGIANLSKSAWSYSPEGLLQPKPMVWLGSFVVAEAFRGADGRNSQTGATVASEIWSTMRSWSQERGVDTMQFMTEEERGAAVAYYRKMGARVIGSARLWDVPLDVADESPMPWETRTRGGFDMYEAFLGRVGLVLHGGDPERQSNEVANYAKAIGAKSAQMISTGQDARLDGDGIQEPSQELLLTVDWAEHER